MSDPNHVRMHWPNVENSGTVVHKTMVEHHLAKGMVVSDPNASAPEPPAEEAPVEQVEESADPPAATESDSGAGARSSTRSTKRER